VLRLLLRHDRARDAGPLADLTPLEREIFDLVAQGATNPEIATQLRLAHGTVRNYVSRLMAKVGVRRRAEVAALAAAQVTGPGGPPTPGPPPRG
jgi:two-component system response regulator DevR